MPAAEPGQRRPANAGGQQDRYLRICARAIIAASVRMTIVTELSTDTKRRGGRGTPPDTEP